MFQCTNGHLMCAGCLSHLLADARLKDETATCPNCRCEISKALCIRNLAVEKAVSELPSDCQYCSKQLPRNELDRHESDLCQERCVQVKQAEWPPTAFAPFRMIMSMFVLLIYINDTFEANLTKILHNVRLQACGDTLLMLL